MQKLTFFEKIYTYHIDFAGHVSNIVYIQWMENCRIRFLEAIGFPVSDLNEEDGITPVLVETNIVYKTPFYMGNEVQIEMWVSKMNNASAIMEFRFFNEKKELCASAWQKGLFIDRKSKRPKRITPEHRIGFEKYFVEG